MAAADRLAEGNAALAEGRWSDGRAAFEAALAGGDSAAACFGSAVALWWLGETRASVERCTRAYVLFRTAGDVTGAAACAVWLGITYKANFANFAAANGWIGRADRLLGPLEPGPPHGWSLVARAYRMADLAEAERLTGRALELARDGDDVDLELTALSQLGLIRVGQGDAAAGFALIDEAVAAALAGERTTLDTVVYACCDMLNACELASDVARAAQWCRVADEFAATYGCPFLYAECRIHYGSVLVATGRWAEAERELDAGARIAEGASPGLHARALTRLAGLRIRQGRLEEADHLLSAAGSHIDADADASLSRAALLLARGDALGASRDLAQRVRRLERHRTHLVEVLDLLVDAQLAAGDLAGAGLTAERLAVVAAGATERPTALAAGARGRVAAARGDAGAATVHLETALAAWSTLRLPFEEGRTAFELARVVGDRREAVALAQRALAAFEELGAAPEADRVAAFLRSRGVAARSGRKRVGVLTDREQQVLRLLGAGLSNPEIAGRLHVSRKTAAHHVSSILAKLDLRNRAEAAAYAVTANAAPDGG